MTFRAKLTRALFICSLLLFAAGLCVYSKETSAAAVEGLLLCGRVLIPSLFPFLVVSSIAIGCGIAEKIGRLLEKPMQKVFNLPGVCATAFILGLIGGYPVGAANAIFLYRSKLCTKVQAERLLAFCNNCGPAFILGVVGASLFGGTVAGLLLYGAHILSSLLVGLIFRFYRRGDKALPAKAAKDTKAAPPISALFTQSVKSSAQSVINVCAYVIFFSVAIKLLYLSGIIPFGARLIAAAATPLDLSPAFTEKLIGGFLELTTGVYGIASSNAALSARLSAAAFILGWAGLSVHFQVLDFMSDSGLSARPYVVGKLLHGGFSSLLAYIGALVIPFDVQTGAMKAGHISALVDASPLLVFPTSLLFALLGWGFLWLLWRFFKERIERKPKR